MKKKITNKYFWSAYNENLFGSIILIVIIVILLCIPFYINHKKDIVDQERADLTTLDLFDDNSIGKYVYIDIFEKPRLIYYDKQYVRQLYVIEQNGKNYIAFLDYDQIEKLSSEQFKSSVVRLYGHTKKADNDTRMKSLDFLKAKIERSNLVMEDYNKYLGCLYFSDSKYGDLDSTIGFCYIMAAILFGVCAYALYLVIRVKINIKKITSKDLSIINKEINEEGVVFFGGICLCNSFLLDTMRMVIYNYDDIELINIKKAKANGIGIGYHIFMKTKGNKKRKKINSTAFIEKSSHNIDDFINYIKNNHSNIDCIRS